MEHSEETPSRVLREFIKLRIGITKLASHLNVTRASIHNWTAGDLKRENLEKIIKAFLELGVQPFEIERELIDMGYDPTAFNINSSKGNAINAKGKKINAGNQTIYAGTSSEEVHQLKTQIIEKDKLIADLKGQLKAYKEILARINFRE